MPSPYRTPHLALTAALATIAFVALVAFGCGSTPAPLPTPEGPEVAACKEYCEMALNVGCPKQGDCVNECLEIAGLGCVDLFIDLLRCAGPALTNECVPRDPQGVLTCTDWLFAYDSCLPIDVGVPLDSCGPSNAESEIVAAGCNGTLECGPLTFSVACDGEGNCTCGKDGETIGMCTSILSSAYLCAPHRSCCAPFFAPA